MNLLVNISLFIFAVVPFLQVQRYATTTFGTVYDNRSMARVILEKPFKWFSDFSGLFSTAMKKSARPVWVTLIIVALSYRLFDAETIRYYASMILAATAKSIKMKSTNIRSMFTEIPDITFPVNKNHTHGATAADRSSASMFIDRLAMRLGFDPVFFQMSKSDQRRGRSGTRSYHWAKDLNAEPSNAPITSNSLLAMVDVDQYVDMPYFLTEYDVPVVLYTFQPDQVGKDTTEYSYSFNTNSVVDYRVSAGGHYRHHVWNYGSDSLIVQNYLFNVIPWKTVVYSIERRQTMDDHQVILLTPLSSWNCFAAWLANLTLSGPRLKRLSLFKDGFLRMYVQKKNGLFVSTGLPDQHLSATVPVSQDNTIANLSNLSKTELNAPQVRSVNIGIGTEASTTLTLYHRSCAQDTGEYVFPVERAIRRYQPYPMQYDPTNKPSLVAFMSPFIDACYAPDRGINSDSEAIRARVTEIRSEAVMTPFLHKIIVEFIELLVPGPHQFAPSDVNRVVDQQNRPTQRSILQTAFVTLFPKRVIKSFMKAESYTAPKPPRNISTTNGSDKLEYSRYMYVFSDYIKVLPWYAFGKTPAETATLVADIAGKSQWVVNSDLSKWDGRYSAVLRELEQMLLMRFFAVEFHEELLDLHSSQFGLKAFTSFGVKYDTEFSRCSGSPETAVFNSMANKFISYLAYRLERGLGSLDYLYTPAEAYAKPGVYGGDDGLSSNMDLECYHMACSMVGQKLEAEKINYGDFGVKFLARVYSPDVWFGSPNSCCDLPRQLAKFHATIVLKPSVTPVDKLLEKCRAYVLTDANTPIIGPYVSRVLKLHGAVVQRQPDLQPIERWGSWLDLSVQYPNGNDAGWMDWYASEVLPGLDSKKFVNWLEAQTTIKALMSLPLLTELEPPVNKGVDVVVNDEVVPGLGQPAVDLQSRIDSMRKVYMSYSWDQEKFKKTTSVEARHVPEAYRGMFFNDNSAHDRVFTPLDNPATFVLQKCYIEALLDYCEEVFQKYPDDYPLCGLSIRPVGVFHVGLFRKYFMDVPDKSKDNTSYTFVMHERDILHVEKYALRMFNGKYFPGTFKIVFNEKPIVVVKKENKKRYDSEEEDPSTSKGPNTRRRKQKANGASKTEAKVASVKTKVDASAKVVKTAKVVTTDATKSSDHLDKFKKFEPTIPKEPDVKVAGKRVAQPASKKQPASGKAEKPKAKQNSTHAYDSFFDDIQTTTAPTKKAASTAVSSVKK